MMIEFWLLKEKDPAPSQKTPYTIAACDPEEKERYAWRMLGHDMPYSKSELAEDFEFVRKLEIPEIK